MLGEREAIEKERELELARRFEAPRERDRRAREGGRQGLRDQGPPAGRARRTSPLIRERYEARARPRPARLRRVQGPLRPQDHRGRDAVARARRDRYGEYFEGGMGADAIKQLIDRIDLDEEEVKLRDADRPAGGPAAPVGPAQAEGHQAPEDRLGVQPPRRPRPPRQRPAGHDPRRRAGDPAGAAPDGAARRWPLRHLRPQRPLPPGHQPEQPAQAPARPGGRGR